MKKRIIGLAILAAYCFPYVFFAMEKDLNERSMLGHIITTIAYIVLLRLCIKTRNIIICIIGNFITYTASSLCLLNVVEEKWTWYFKPFNAKGFLLFLSILLAAMQIVIFCYIYFRKRAKHKES